MGNCLGLSRGKTKTWCSSCIAFCRRRMADRLAPSCQRWKEWQHASHAVHAWYGHLARRPETVAGAALHWRDSLSWQVLQCMIEADRRAGEWGHPPSIGVGRLRVCRRTAALDRGRGVGRGGGGARLRV